MATTRTAPGEEVAVEPLEAKQQHTGIELSPTSIALYAILVIYGIFSLLPFIFAFVSSFKPEAQVLATPPALVPEPTTLQHYQDIFKSAEFPFPNYIVNSI